MKRQLLDILYAEFFKTKASIHTLTTQANGTHQHCDKCEHSYADDYRKLAEQQSQYLNFISACINTIIEHKA